MFVFVFGWCIANELRLFWAKVLFTIVSHSYRYNVFSYDAVLRRDSNLLPSRQRANALRVTQPSISSRNKLRTNINNMM